ncbi:hypothetical protein Tco_0035176, partial [Tanacetum coccineum]
LMELAHGTREVSQCAPEDVICSMPDKVITNILNCLPIQDAIKTGRFEGKGNFIVKNLSKLLLQLKGPITKFVLLIPYGIKYDVEDLYHFVLIMSRKGIKELTLDNATYDRDPLEWPTQIYSCIDDDV